MEIATRLRPAILAVLPLALATAFALRAPRSYDSPSPLSYVDPPTPDDLDKYVRNEDAAIQLGKALFWDMQVGTDGVQTCASCHFTAGVDNRLKNQMSPSGRGSGDPLFSFGGPNYTLQTTDFPIPRTSNEVVGSQGTYHSRFVFASPGAPADEVDFLPDEVFQVAGTALRQVEPRNAPTSINSIFNFRNLWDGRANNAFNGRSPFGARDRSAKIWVRTPWGLEAERRLIKNASLASVAVGPPVDSLEAGSVDRTWPVIGKRLLQARPLARQYVHPSDSRLASLRRPDRGLNGTYEDLVEAAFQSRFIGNHIVKHRVIDGQDVYFSQTEENFSFFFGLAIMMYLKTQVSDDTPFDDYLAGNHYALTDRQQEGFDLFYGKAKCSKCHGGPDLTDAGFALQEADREGALVNTYRRRDYSILVYDRGFFNVGVRKTRDDKGLGRHDDFGNDLSFSRQTVKGLFVDDFHVSPWTFTETDPWDRSSVDGAFKTPGLRNVELTAPYFHNGGAATLRQVVDMFSRGGDFLIENAEWYHPDMGPVYLSNDEKDALVDFMVSLTDERVRLHQAPFDHPQLFVPDGHPGNEFGVQLGADGVALTDFVEIPAVGAAGYGVLPDAVMPFDRRLGLGPFDAAPAGARTAFSGIPAPVQIQTVTYWKGHYGMSIPIVGTFNFGVFRGDGEGPALWRRIYTGLPDPLVVNDALTTRDGDIFIGTWGSAGMYKSIDGGLTWTAVDLSGADITGTGIIYAVVEGRDGTLWASADRGRIIMSRDGGDTWRFLSTLPGASADTPWALAAHPKDVEVVMAGTFGNGVFLSIDGGRSWKHAEGTGLGPDGRIQVFDLEFVPERHREYTLWAGTALGVFRSDDLGTTWEDLTDGIGPAREVRDLAVVPKSFGAIAAAVWGGGVYTLYSDYQFGHRRHGWHRIGLEDQKVSAIAIDPDTGAMAAIADDTGGHILAIELGSETAVAVDPALDVPVTAELTAAYPNPFNPTTTLEFGLPSTDRVRMSVFDLLGREVRVLVDQEMAPGQHRITFDANGLRSGTYLVRMQTGSAVSTRSLTLLK